MKRILILLAIVVGFAMAGGTASAWGPRGYYGGYYRAYRPYYAAPGYYYGPGYYGGYYRAPYYSYPYYGGAYYGPGVGLGFGVY